MCFSTSPLKALFGPLKETGCFEPTTLILASLSSDWLLVFWVTENNNNNQHGPAGLYPTLAGIVNFKGDIALIDQNMTPATSSDGVVGGVGSEVNLSINKSNNRNHVPVSDEHWICHHKGERIHYRCHSSLHNHVSTVIIITFSTWYIHHYKIWYNHYLNILIFYLPPRMGPGPIMAGGCTSVLLNEPALFVNAERNEWVKQTKVYDIHVARVTTMNVHRMKSP